MSNNSYYNDQWRIINEKNQSLVSNYSMEFDGTSDKIEFGDVNSFERTDSFSFSLWVNISSYGTYYYISKQLSSGQFTGYNLFSTSNGKLQFLLNNNFSSNTLYVTSTSQIPVNQWVHLTLTYDGSSLASGVNMYFNGVSETIITVYNTLTATTLNTTQFQISGRDGGNGNIVGKIDQVSIFDYELSASQVSTLYGGGTAVTNPMTLSPKPISYYQLGDQSVDNGANYLVPNNSLSDYVFDFPVTNYTVNPDKIFLNNQAQVFNNATNFSFSGWFKINIDRNQNIFEIKDGSNYRFNINYYYVVDALRFNIDTSGAGNYADAQNLISDGKIAIGEWFHYAGVFNGSGATNADRTKLYINGQEQTLNFGGTQATSLGAIGATNTISLGNLISSAFIQFGGQASNIQMWDVSLSSSEVTTLYNNGSPYTATQPQSSNLRFWYKLNAADTFNSSTSTWTIKDYAGSNDATSDRMTSSNLVVSDLQQTSGYSPYALSLDGTDDFLDCGTTTNYDTGDLSVAIWVNASSSRTGTVYAFSNSGSPSFAGFDFVINTSNQIRIRRSTMTKSNETSFLTTGFSSDTWQHLAFTYNESTNTIKVFLNAVLQDTSIGFTQTNTASKKLTIGSYKGTGNFFNGELSNAVIWNTELTSTQVTEIYNEGRPSDLHSFSTAPVAWWQLGSNSSFNTNWTCLDEIGTNNAVSAGGMTNDDIVDGPGYSASGLGTSSIDIKGDAPYSTANGLSENMDVLDRTTDVPS